MLSMQSRSFEQAHELSSAHRECKFCCCLLAAPEHTEQVHLCTTGMGAIAVGCACEAGTVNVVTLGAG